MNKSIYTILFTAVVALAITSCGSKRNPGKVYMPDMAYSRAYEAYSELDTNVYTMNRTDAHKIYFNAMPPAGTVKRGELPAYTGTNDSAGYKASASLQNPVTVFTKDELAEAGRLYNINCGICHGDKGTGNGPIAGKIGAVANLTLPMYVSMTDGTMFHSLTYGKNNMGSYASQLDRKQRWMVINYVRTLQPKATTAGGADSASVAKK
ncbi:MAG: cytochrome c [Ferruginibacter sp.]|nr:cytochrome c [Ferruginibacter sp.]